MVTAEMIVEEVEAMLPGDTPEQAERVEELAAEVAEVIAASGDDPDRWEVALLVAATTGHDVHGPGETVSNALAIADAIISLI